MSRSRWPGRAEVEVNPLPGERLTLSKTNTGISPVLEGFSLFQNSEWPFAKSALQLTLPPI